MRDEHVGELELLLQLQQQVEDLSLHADVECRHRFVGDDERRAQSQRTGDSDSLALSAAEFVRIAIGVLGCKTHAVEQRPRRIQPLAAIADSEVAQRLRNDLAEPQARVQRGVGILQDHLHVPP